MDGLVAMKSFCNQSVNKPFKISKDGYKLKEDQKITVIVK